MEININSPLVKNYPDASISIREFLINNSYIFEENVTVNINSMINDVSIRPIDVAHVELLLNRMKNSPNDIDNLLNQTPVITFTGQTVVNAFSYKRYFVIDGNHRLEATLRYNMAQVGHFINSIPISFNILSADVPLEHKLALTSMAESKIYQNKKPLNKYEIMSHARYLLKKCPALLGLDPLPEDATTVQQKQYSKKVVQTITNFFHVGHPSLVLSNIWKSIRISDADFNKMYKRFPDLPSGFDVNDFDVVFNKYVLSPGQITKLMTMEPFPPLNEFRKMLRAEVKKDFIPLLRHHKAHKPIWDVREHLCFIGGEEYVTANGIFKSEEIIEKYLNAKKRNLRRFQDTEEKLKYLRRNFHDWLKDESNIGANSDQADEPSNSTQIGSVCKKVPKNLLESHIQTTLNFVEMLVQNNRKSVAAFVVHYLLRPHCHENQLPDFYLNYVHEGKFDLTKLPADDVSYYQAVYDIDRFGMSTYFHLTPTPASRRKRVLSDESTTNFLSQKRANNNNSREEKILL